jgi:tetratricopeptide (TPR) repeat protein
LIDAQSGGHLWAERFDGAWGEVFALQDKVVENVAGALKLRLVAGGDKAQIAGGTSNPAAYEAFLRGLELELRGTPADIAKAVTYYEQALALDPDFGRATAELAWVYWNATIPVTDAMGFKGNTVDKVNQYLEEAAKHPSPTYYQILAEQLVWRKRPDEGIAALEKAIALDSSDAWSYEGMASALSLSGRAADGRGYVDAAMRVDPGWTSWRHYLAGLAYFGMDRFEDAIASFEKIDFQSGGHWANLNGLILRLSADGHLGRDGDIAVVKEKLKQVLSEDGQPELTGLMAQNLIPYKNYADVERMLDGLRKAGVPELPFGFDPKSPDRLSGAEIKALFFGHEIQGQEVLGGGGAYWRKTEEDGSYRAMVWDKTFKGVTWLEGDIMCIASKTRPIACRAVYRNPAGSFDQKNEYLYFRDIDRFEFSVVK